MKGAFTVPMRIPAIRMCCRRGACWRRHGAGLMRVSMGRPAASSRAGVFAVRGRRRAEGAGVALRSRPWVRTVTADQGSPAASPSRRSAPLRHPALSSSRSAWPGSCWNVASVSYPSVRYGEMGVAAGLPAPARTVPIIAWRLMPRLIANRTLESKVNGSSEGIPSPRQSADGFRTTR